MKKKLIIITNESIYSNNNESFFCDNIDLKSIPESLNEYFSLELIARKSKKERSKKIDLSEIKISKNIYIFLNSLFNSFNQANNNYLIISLSPYTFMASLLLKLFKKKHYIYLRSDGYKEYKAILGNIGSLFYHIMYKFGLMNAELIACRKHLLKGHKGHVVNPSQLNEKWFKNIQSINIDKVKLLYVGRLKVEKGIFSLIRMLEGSNIELTIITSEKKITLKKDYENIKLLNFENHNDSIIKMYDKHNIFILPSFTEAHPQVLDEALARQKPVIVFKDIEHVKRDRNGIFCCDRNLRSLEETIKYIQTNYDNIIDKIRMNKLPMKSNFIKELKNILSS